MKALTSFIQNEKILIKITVFYYCLSSWSML
ncbi:hypothetical protein VSDKYIMU_CDS0180 [Enterococcus phage VRE9_4]